MTEDWMCNCGNYIEDGLHCPSCGAEPPWGCPCEGCQCYEDDEYLRHMAGDDIVDNQPFDPGTPIHDEQKRDG